MDLIYRFRRDLAFPFFMWRTFPLAEERARYWKLREEKWRFQFLSKEEQEACQLEKLRALLLHAGTNIPYYRDLFRSLRFDPAKMRNRKEIEALPILTKEMIQDNRERLLVPNPEAYRAYANATGGSTGFPLNFYQSRDYWLSNAADTWTCDGTAGRTPGMRLAELWGAPRDVPRLTKLRLALRVALTGHRFYNAFDMSEARMLRYYQSMQRARPEVMIVYGESLYILALFLQQNGLKANFPARSIITSAATLFDHTRAKIEEVFKAPVFDRYGSREVGLIAYECEQHCGLHLNPHEQLVELLGDDPERTPAEIIITNLTNYAMPLIRYRIGDLAISSPHRCRCGRAAPLLARIVGRVTDTITTQDGSLIHGAHFRHLLFGFPGIRNYQFIQETVDKFRLLIVPNAQFQTQDQAQIRQRILHTVGDRSALEIEIVEQIPPTSSGKHRFIISKVPLPLRSGSLPDGQNRQPSA